MLIGKKTDIGRVRNINQDSMYVSDSNNMPIYIVADGMGGHKAGEIASSMARDLVIESLYKNYKKLDKDSNILRALKSAIEEANTKIYLKALQNNEFKGMGTTIIVTYIGNEYLHIGHVGDSRAYIIRGGEIFQLTEDHSLVNQLLKSGSISLDEAEVHPRKNMITRAVGSSSIIEVDLISEHYENNDILLIMTDGISNMVKDKELLSEFKSSDDMQKSCEKIVEKANARGGKDNSTIIAVKFSNEVKV